ncbi:MAG: hypothetical protein U0Y96_05670 [Candidatus Kapaibacterium sp.]|nr:hypothetical protein [Bacteroidota bacterium]
MSLFYWLVLLFIVTVIPLHAGNTTVVYSPPIKVQFPRSINLYIVKNDTVCGAKKFADTVYTFEISKKTQYVLKGIKQEFWLVQFNGEECYLLDADVQKMLHVKLLNTEIIKGEAIPDSITNQISTLQKSVRCSGVNKSGSRCKRRTTHENGRCWQHQ